MKSLLCLIFFALFFNPCFSQDKDYYVVFNKGDTLYTYVNSKSNHKKVICYDTQGKRTIYKIDSVKLYYRNSIVYERVTYNSPAGVFTKFLEKMSGGEVSLYLLKNESKGSGYSFNPHTGAGTSYATKIEPTYVLKRSTGIGQSVRSGSLNHYNDLKNFFHDYPEFMKKKSDIYLDLSDIERLVLRYNTWYKFNKK
jgi:hypothetical protein